MIVRTAPASSPGPVTPRTTAPASDLCGSRSDSAFTTTGQAGSAAGVPAASHVVAAGNATPSPARTTAESLSSSVRAGASAAPVSRVPSTAGSTGRRARVAAIASAQASAVRKAGTPASFSMRSDSSASGNAQAASGTSPAAAASAIADTASSGLSRAEEPTTNRTRSNSPLDRSTSSAPSTRSCRVPASVRSTMRFSATSSPSAASPRNTAGLGRATVTPRVSSWSTTIAAPPPVEVITPIRSARTGPGGPIRRWRASVSMSASKLSTRANPQARKKASASSSSPASAPVCDTDRAAAASLRPSL